MRFPALATLALLGLASTALADPTVYGTGSEPFYFDTSGATPDQRDAIERNSTQKYFGAVYIEPGGTAWGSYTGANTLYDAAALARMICLSHAQSDTCVPALFVAPPELGTGSPPRDSLGHGAAQKYRTYQGRNDGWRAFAVSGNHAFGWATRKETAAQAVESALTYCHQSSLKSLLDLPQRVREEARLSGHYDCRIADLDPPAALDPS
ncbi:hypothetical protein KDD17_08805 [Sulfitobacter albidus]|uniref:DUF4189 domain-containing protein n=1 Tax=Sulfitobacter albidus TaxID=2829501 RepID=A0A975JBC6_9RHOB|nr:hypothetical protein [Sulfitobacter albidus]QUJ75130.1 hypothetical protein KDD17_08805 [Sulfitobacter albidus]